MKPADPPALRVTRLLDQVRERIRYKHYSLRTGLGYAMAPSIVRRRPCRCALTDCSGSIPADHDVGLGGHLNATEIYR